MGPKDLLSKQQTVYTKNSILYEVSISYMNGHFSLWDWKAPNVGALDIC